MRKWTVNMADPDGDDLSKDENAEYVPTYDEAQLFKWRGYWVEIRRTMITRFNPSIGNQLSTTLFVTCVLRYHNRYSDTENLLGIDSTRVT